MKKSICFITGMLLLFFPGCRLVDRATPQEEAKQILADQLKRGRSFTKVRAAEALINAKSTNESMMADFQKLLDDPSTERPDQVGYNRVLLQLTQKDVYRDAIKKIAVGDDLNGRIHAIETAAKFNISFNEEELAKIRALSLSTGDEKRLERCYSLWVLENHGDQSAGQRLNSFLDGSSEVECNVATYRFIFIKPANDALIEQLQSLLHSKYPFVHSFAILALATHRLLRTEELSGLRKMIAENTGGANCSFLINALGQAGNEQDVPLLIPFLSDENSSLQIAAAAAILEIKSPAAQSIAPNNDSLSIKNCHKSTAAQKGDKKCK